MMHHAMKTVPRPGAAAGGLSWPRGARPASAGPRGGAALMLSLLVLLVLVAVVFQINIATTTDARVARNDISLSTMDLAIESAMLEVFEQLKADAEAAAAEGSAGGAPGGASPFGGAMAGGAGGAEGGAAGAIDSRRDDWARPQRTEINGVSMRILIEDESRKLNVLGMLTEDEEQAELAYQRVVRVIDFFREGTDDDVSGGDAETAARALREHLTRRSDSRLPRAPLLSDDPEADDIGLPLTLAEMVVAVPFEADWFRDRRNEDDIVLHGLDRYLTVWSSLQTQGDLIASRNTGPSGAGGAGGSGGPSGAGSGGAGGAAAGAPGAAGSSGAGGTPQGAQTAGSQAGSAAPRADSGLLSGGGAGEAWKVNLNTAPPVVLKSLTDDRDVHPRLWDQVIEHRNLEDEEENDPDADPVLDEYGEPILVRKIFSNAQELESMDEWTRMEPQVKNDILNLVGVSSEVFTIYITARIDTDTTRAGAAFATREEQERYEESAGQLVRTVRCVVWRRTGEQGAELVPIQRWKVLDYQPYEILDYPGEDR